MLLHFQNLHRGTFKNWIKINGTLDFFSSTYSCRRRIKLHFPTWDIYVSWKLENLCDIIVDGTLFWCSVTLPSTVFVFIGKHLDYWCWSFDRYLVPQTHKKKTSTSLEVCQDKKANDTRWTLKNNILTCLEINFCCVIKNLITKTILKQWNWFWSKPVVQIFARKNK